MVVGTQLHSSSRSDDSGWSICILLLGLQQAKRHTHIPSTEFVLEDFKVRLQKVVFLEKPYNFTLVLDKQKVIHVSFRYHMGTIAFGALIIAIIQMIRIVLEYLDQKLKGKENKVVKFILWYVFTVGFLSVIELISGALMILSAHI